MRFSRTVAIVLAVGLAVQSAFAIACQTKRVVSPQELVAKADGIYLVRAEGYDASYSPAVQGSVPRIRFSVLARLKGKEPKALIAPGILVETDDPNDSPFPFDFVRPAGRRGMCFATEYKAGAAYLLLYRAGTPYWSRLAPTNEQVTGSADRWVVWVRNQVREG